MKEFKLEGYVKPLILLTEFLIIFITFKILTTGNFAIQSLVISGALLIFAVYLLKSYLALRKDIFTKVAIDETSGQYVLTTTKNEICAIPFDNIAYIKICKGEVLRGISIAHIKFFTTDERVCGVTISNVESFCVNIPHAVKKDFDEAIFYHPRWNKLN